MHPRGAGRAERALIRAHIRRGIDGQIESAAFAVCLHIRNATEEVLACLFVHARQNPSHNESLEQESNRT